MQEQPISLTQLRVIEKHLDKMFGALKLDVVFTKHFFERLNDPRNIDQITPAELIKVFTSLYEKYGVTLSHIGSDEEIDRLVHSISTDINIPIQVLYDKKTKKIDIISKTIMRVDKFFSKSKELPVESLILTFNQFCESKHF